MNRSGKMKAIIPLAVVVFTTTLSTSCNSEEYVPPIVGTWLQASSSTEEFTNNVSDGITTETIDADNFIRITFNADGTFSDFQSYSYTDNGDVIVETSTDTGTYSTFGNLLSIYDGDTETAEFTLILKIVESNRHFMRTALAFGLFLLSVPFLQGQTFYALQIDRNIRLKPRRSLPSINRIW
ncbi:lipocalin family protein [Allomuricauda sp. R78024]|uniref:lipocalin family protein n=1 Tax=Allomuricauda sp. R78024 TaxID=3093867 RepID=UPI0037C8A1B3